MVIGADGVNSNVRLIMRELAMTAHSSPKVVNDEKPYLCTYRLMFGNAPRLPQVEEGLTCEAHGSKVSTQLFIGHEKMWFFVLEELAKPTQDLARYTRADEDAFAQRMAHTHMSDRLTFGDVYEARCGAGLTNLGEGVLKTWGWNRIVLAGDAAHKATPNIGWGFNAGAWSNGVMRFLDRYLWPALNVDKVMSNHYVGPLVSAVPILDFLEENSPHKGRIPWVHAGVPAAGIATA
jgi:2-polyprenyl-6-methoxyphenol hydroxylase-like FAD-dependent oxidoreductase